jgi:uncharacterized protein
MERRPDGVKYDGFLPGRHLIEGYGSGGFSFGGMTHRGSILATPSGIHAFDATDILLVSESSLTPLFEEREGAVNLLVVGTGASFILPPRALRDLLKARGIGIDPMATAHAVSTYNILLGESRPVAALLLAAP